MSVADMLASPRCTATRASAMARTCLAHSPWTLLQNVAHSRCC